jgi:putative ABC transport system permease protein
MILSMYALVVFTLALITVFSHLFAQQVDDFTARVAGGFDVRIDSNAADPVPLDAVRARPEVAAVAPILTTLAQFDVAGVTDGFKPWPAATFDATYVDRGPVALTRRSSEYPTDRAAYQALLSRPDLVIPSAFFLQSGGGPPRRTVRVGDTVLLRDPRSGRTRQLRAAAIAETGFANVYAYVSPDAMRAVFGPALTPNLLFIKLKPGADAERFAASLNGAYVANGADARSFRSLVAENLAQQQQFFRLMRGYLALGLLVGIAGLGVVMVRAVRERRRQVGVLRSLGFSAVAVRRAFVAESAFVALEGILIGVSLAILTAWRLTGGTSFGSGLRFSVPWSALAILVLGTFLASLLATAAPAQQASHIRPAVALRIAD